MRGRLSVRMPLHYLHESSRCILLQFRRRDVCVVPACTRRRAWNYSAMRGVMTLTIRC